MTVLTIAFTMSANAAPLTTVIARSITWPRSRKALWPFPGPAFFFSLASESSSAGAAGGAHSSPT